jgi:Raf kinase inhibitor-like YbhB/YbcL family protein
MQLAPRRATGSAAALAGFVLVAAMLGAACAGPASGPPATEDMATFRLTSPSFDEGGPIPRQHSCDGRDASPALAWSGAPAAARAMALVMDDPDAGGFVHWVVFNLGAAVDGELPEGITPAWQLAPQGRNGFGRIGYGGPCPPGGTHHYVFRLLALDAPLSLDATPRADDVLAAAGGHVLGEARLTGTYRRAG